MRVTSSVVVQAFVEIEPGALIWLNQDVELRLAGGFRAPSKIVFDCAAASRVVFAEGTADEVDVRWWGFAEEAPPAINDAAIRAARDSLAGRGVVRFPSGVFRVAAYTPINRSYLKFQGASAFGTTLVPVTGSRDVTGIDGLAQPGFVQAVSDYIDQCEHVDISVARFDGGTATVSLGANQTPAEVPTGARGFVHRFAANARIRAVLAGSPIDYYESQTTGAQVDIRVIRNAAAGDNAATLRFGVVSDCTSPTRVDRSSNGSSYKRCVSVVHGFAGEAWGVLAYGDDLRDHFWDSLETAGGAHAVDYVCRGARLRAWDILFARMVLDGWSLSGARFVGLPKGSGCVVMDGYSAPGAAGDAVGPSVLAFDAHGLVLGDGFEAKGGVNHARHTGVALSGGAGGCTIRAHVTGCRYGVTVDAGAGNLVSARVEALPAQPVEAAIQLVNGANHNLVEGWVVSAADDGGGVNVGVLVDLHSHANEIGSGLTLGAVRQVVRVAGRDVGTPGSYGDNRVLDGALNT